MKKYSSIVWLVLCLGFTGNVAFGENENVDLSEDQGVIAPLADNKTAAQALVEFVTIARSELEGHKSDEGSDYYAFSLLVNEILGSPIDSEKIRSVFKLKRDWYDDQEWVQYMLPHIYGALTAYCVTSDQYYFYYLSSLFLLTEWYGKGFINVFIMNAIVDRISQKYVPYSRKDGQNTWVDTFAKTLLYHIGSPYLVEANPQQKVWDILNDGFTLVSGLKLGLAEPDSESAE